jgi:hypothetical protein
LFAVSPPFDAIKSDDERRKIVRHVPHDFSGGNIFVQIVNAQMNSDFKTESDDEVKDDATEQTNSGYPPVGVSGVQYSKRFAPKRHALFRIGHVTVATTLVIDRHFREE